jgi:hypothetical protein
MSARTPPPVADAQHGALRCLFLAKTWHDAIHPTGRPDLGIPPQQPILNLSSEVNHARTVVLETQATIQLVWPHMGYRNAHQEAVNLLSGLYSHLSDQIPPRAPDKLAVGARMGRRGRWSCRLVLGRLARQIPPNPPNYWIERRQAIAREFEAERRHWEQITGKPIPPGRHAQGAEPTHGSNDSNARDRRAASSGRQQQKRPTVEQCMMVMLRDDPAICAEWTAPQWAEALVKPLGRKVTPAAVKQTKTWQETISKYRAMERSQRMERWR